MRHRMRGRKLGRNASHRRAMFRNMAGSLIRSIRPEADDLGAPSVQGRIVTTLPRARELRPFVEKLITLARRAGAHEERARTFSTAALRNSDEWREWRRSPQWNQWNQAIAPAVALRRRAFALLRDSEAVDILFDELAERFADRPGGYTRVVRLATVRLGDAAPQALIEFVGERDRKRSRRSPAPVVAEDEQPADRSADKDETFVEEVVDKAVGDVTAEQQGKADTSPPSA